MSMVLLMQSLFYEERFSWSYAAFNMHHVCHDGSICFMRNLYLRTTMVCLLLGYYQVLYLNTHRWFQGVPVRHAWKNYPGRYPGGIWWRYLSKCNWPQQHLHSEFLTLSLSRKLFSAAWIWDLITKGQGTRKLRTLSFGSAPFFTTLDQQATAALSKLFHLGTEPPNYLERWIKVTDL